MRGSRLPSAFALSLAVVALLPSLAAACPYPLGPFVPEGNFVTWGGGDDPEMQIVEATLIHGQKSFGIMVNTEGRLHFLYNAEVEYEANGNPQETHSIFYRSYSNDTGWDVPIQYLASENTSTEIPDGRNVAPYATAAGDTAWAVWEVSGATTGRPNGSYVVMRGITPTGFTPIQHWGHTEVDSANKYSKIITLSDAPTKMYLAWQTNAHLHDSNEFRIAGRTWDGTNLGPIENISIANDGWSDNLVAIATDGQRVAAAWASDNTTLFSSNGNGMLKAAVRSPSGVWSPEFNLTVPNNVTATNPSIGFYGGRVWVAWSTNDPAVTGRTDFDIAMRSFHPQTLALDSTVDAVTPDFKGFEGTPALTVYDGRLQLLFASGSSPQGIPTSGNDTDIYYRTFDGTLFSPTRLVSDPSDASFQEGAPGFFEVEGGLHAFWLENICLPGCGHETDWREMTRLLARPQRWYDDLHALYTVPAMPQEGAQIKTGVSVSHADGAAAPSTDYWMLPTNGSAERLEGVFSPDGAVPRVLGDFTLFDADIVYNTSYLVQFHASYCGKRLPTQEIVASGSKTAPVSDVLLPALLVAGLAAALRARSSRRE